MGLPPEYRGPVSPPVTVVPTDLGSGVSGSSHEGSIPAAHDGGKSSRREDGPYMTSIRNSGQVGEYLSMALRQAEGSLRNGFLAVSIRASERARQ